ncbi:Uncharacterised protein [Vibrio cholerae]|nr:Uncharacterised protein [Vibrio cholerae]
MDFSRLSFRAFCFKRSTEAEEMILVICIEFLLLANTVPTAEVAEKT